MPESNLKSAQFRRERERSWKELERIVDTARKRGVLDLTARDLLRLPGLYRGAVSALSVARAISLDRNVLDYLEALVARAFVLVYTSRRPAGEVIVDFFANGFPRAAYRLHRLFLVSCLLLLAGFACGFSLTAADLERFYSFVPEGMAQGRTPEASPGELRKVLFEESDEVAKSGLTMFSSFLFTHNAMIGILCFALGFVAGIPVVLLLFYNGLILGAMSALHASKGLLVEFLGWVMGHGVTELGAVCLCGAAGLAVGGSILFPGRHTRSATLAIEGRAVAPVVIGSVFLFLVAAVLEGYFRQLVAETLLRWLMAGGTLFLWSVYFIARGRVRA